jgi:hypothetical protein
MHRMPFGTVLALFDAMAGYIELTSPFGSGEGSDASAPSGQGLRSDIAADEPGAFKPLAPMMSHAQVLTPDQVPADIRDLLDPNYHPTRPK